MKRSNQFAVYIILAILIIFVIIFLFYNKTIEGLTSITYPSNFCSKVKQQENCQTNWTARDYFKTNPSKLIQNSNPCVWTINAQYPNGICQNSTSASAWGFSFTDPTTT